MNRAERRRNNAKKEPVYNVKASDIRNFRDESDKKAADQAFFLMLAIPNMVIHDHFGELMRKKGREERFCDLCLRTYECFEDGLVSIDDLTKCLWEEAGVKIEREAAKCK